MEVWRTLPPNTLCTKCGGLSKKSSKGNPIWHRWAGEILCTHCYNTEVGKLKNNSGANNPRYGTAKSNNYFSLHGYIRKRMPKPNSCGDCGKQTTYLDLANVSGKYLRDLSDWEYICRRCHMMKDGRLASMIIRNHSSQTNQ